MLNILELSDNMDMNMPCNVTYLNFLVFIFIAFPTSTLVIVHVRAREFRFDSVTAADSFDRHACQTA